MTTYMYCVYVGFDYIYIDINVLAQGIKYFWASQVWFQSVAGARTYDTDSPAITSQPRKPFGHRDIPKNNDKYYFKVVDPLSYLWFSHCSTAGVAKA